MVCGTVKVPPAHNEPVLSYAPDSPERAELKHALKDMADGPREIPMVIGGRRASSQSALDVCMPHLHPHVLARVHQASAAQVEEAIEAARKSRAEWSRMPFADRAAIFLKAAELISTRHRARLNAATMLGQSKTVYQSEIDAVCEAADFLRFNVSYANQIFSEQPESSPGVWNRMDYRPLDGFVLAVSPFNFTSIALNLCTAPALMGNTVLFKPAHSASLSAWHLVEVFREAGLPDGVINFIPGSGAEVAQVALASSELGGIHFTGSTAVFQSLWRRVGENISRYRQYPRLVGETGGKDFIFAHRSAEDDLEALAVAIVRGGYEYQGQKCSACSRVFAPASLWPKLKSKLVEMISEIKMGDVRDFRNFMGAVIDESAFQNARRYLENAKAGTEATILAGGKTESTRGWFIEPTLVQLSNPRHPLLCEEIFAPVVGLYVYPDAEYEKTLALCDESTPYALTGAIFARDRKAIALASDLLRHAAGNFYINDKPTGAVVGQQPFGGSRASGTNDKAGSGLNLLRWTSPRTLKETFVPPTELGYPSMASE